MSIKDAYLEKMEAQLREWGAKIDELKAKWDAAQTKLGEIKAAGEEAWEILKPGVESAWSELKAAIDGAATKFN
ncbi:hypothetical protein YTPLAS72_05620 [Nitrospira sp.]|nr:hypothetical protein YTPLAS72_05620 [Nitrospira sp.]